MSKMISASNLTSTDETIKELRLILSSLKPSNQIDASRIKNCIQLTEVAESNHRKEYARISKRLDNEVYGSDIMRTKPGSISDVEEMGIDAIKTIIFDEMGFDPAERLVLEQ